MSDNYYFNMRHNIQSVEIDLTEEQKAIILQRALGDIQSRLQVTGHSLSEYPSMPQDYVTELEELSAEQSLEMAERRSYSAEEEQRSLGEYERLLNAEQQTAYSAIIASISMQDTEKATRLFFVDCTGGTGKSLLFKALLSYVRSQSEIALPVATSGIAAILLPVLHLTQNTRLFQSGPLASEFAEKLLAIVNGEGEHEHIMYIPVQWHVDSEYFETLINKVYPHISSVEQQPC
ncbi:hypothetical protein PHYBLDRAFT_170204 [Phycomyces blakesleeanus NRRL 1555(-)]|uniref:ATP-dependent DNA helicase n=1 Tax=Phycomyces blakesleeanus (strain ATCC 8743b / DSM 1359 / FGSC 10004 / NBRC 33097 / NRRL 1555) TaxID=763407 RepID=A0A162U1E5_PHYB8|nr:hypothetical protein PHYBLDRAFT_170204 [Phycomyces blakesleeanus NRRL 1555(-)]OAD71543.1 hypothetical protein PHYBLDRAFT_170204 [Phycomyces blakesleeanus NRRL 1555(-)]|eukprot:XP_018289583.1 hypothetical protein PHYBLDRAFT_170204 [Phycomyces blakesleeanus NRRL 1555(-)]